MQVLHPGQEIYLFFYKFGINGLFGIIFCNIIIGYIIYKTLNLLFENDIKTYEDFLKTIIPQNKANNKIFIINTIINAFLLSTFFIMILGFGTYFEQNLKINKMLVISIFSILCFITFLGNIEKITKINGILLPFLIITLTIIGITNLFQIKLNQIGLNTKIITNHMWIIKAILYASYNLILLIPVLINLKKFLKRKKMILKISIITSIIIATMSIFIFLLLIRVDIDFNNIQMPAIYVMQKYYKKYEGVYGIIILASIYTTAISTGISFLNNISKNKKQLLINSLTISILSIIISNIPFAEMVKILFSIFGYLGLIQIYFIMRS